MTRLVLLPGLDGTGELFASFIDARARVAAILAVDCRAQLRRIEVPMLYLRARDDRLVPASAGHAIQELRPDCEFIEIDAPHFLLQTEPKSCAAAVLAFARP